jgi:hypothetical protein
MKIKPIRLYQKISWRLFCFWKYKIITSLIFILLQKKTFRSTANVSRGWVLFNVCYISASDRIRYSNCNFIVDYSLGLRILRALSVSFFTKRYIGKLYVVLPIAKFALINALMNKTSNINRFQIFFSQKYNYTYNFYIKKIKWIIFNLNTEATLTTYFRIWGVLGYLVVCLIKKISNIFIDWLLSVLAN